MLFELLVLSSAQVGSDWTSILKKRQDFRLVIYTINYTKFVRMCTYCLYLNTQVNDNLFLCVHRDAFSGFDAETVANLTDKQMMSISTQYAIDMSRVRGVVDNAIRILEVLY